MDRANLAERTDCAGRAGRRAEVLESRPTLRAWLDSYAEIRRGYVEGVEGLGVPLGPVGCFDARVHAVRERLRAKGAHERNGGASVWVGPLSPACEACATGLGSATFAFSMRCNRSCYFCFNANQVDGDEGRCAYVRDGRRDLDEFAATVDEVTHVGLSGGEPLLWPEESLAFLRHARHQHPAAHLRLYTTGDALDEGLLGELRDAGLDELRMSVKLDVLDVDDAPAIIDQAAARLELARRFVPHVLVEMPVIPGTQQAMRTLLDRLDVVGIDGINLLEFGFPLGRWEEFGRRGFLVKNPPHPVPYDYSYPAGLPIDGSELACLELVEYAIDRGLRLGVHYCSLENKNRGQVYRQNAAVQLDPAVWELDGEDFFYKVAKVFDADVPLVQRRLAELGERCELDETDGSLAFHPSLLGVLGDGLAGPEAPGASGDGAVGAYDPEALGVPTVVPALSYNVVERCGETYRVREVMLELAEDEGGWGMASGCMGCAASETASAHGGRGGAAEGDRVSGACEAERVLAPGPGEDACRWQGRAVAWELCALSLAYPGEELAGAVASGEWEDAAREVAAVLGVELPRDWGVGLAQLRGRDEGELLHELRVEATRLLVGAPQPAVSPYEGVWRAQDEGTRPLLYVSPASMDVERTMRACGMGRPQGTNDPIDRIDTELEFLEWLCAVRAGMTALPEGIEAAGLPGRSVEGTYEGFLREHALVWMPRFARAVSEASGHPFYAAAAGLLACVLEAQARA